MSDLINSKVNLLLLYWYLAYLLLLEWHFLFQMTLIKKRTIRLVKLIGFVTLLCGCLVVCSRLQMTSDSGSEQQNTVMYSCHCNGEGGTNF